MSDREQLFLNGLVMLIFFRLTAMRYFTKHILLEKKMRGIETVLEKERLITAKEVERLTGLGRVTLWRKSNNEADPFPQAYRNGTHYTRWKLSEILEWIESLRVNQEELA